MRHLDEVVAVALATVEIGAEDKHDVAAELLGYVGEHYIERRPSGLQRLAELPVEVLSQVASCLGICFPAQDGRINVESEGGMSDGKEN